jgi:hypothetical protein
LISLVAKSPQIWLALGSRAVPPARLPHELGPAVALVRVAKRRNAAEVAVAPDSAEGFYVVERALHEIVDMRARAGRCQSDGERGPEGGQRVVALLARQALAVGPVLLDPRKQAPELGQVVRLEEARAVRPRIHFSNLFLQKGRHPLEVHVLAKPRPHHLQRQRRDHWRARVVRFVLGLALVL